MKGIFERWPQKLAALVLATFVWFFVNVSDTSTSQRGLIVPVEVEGLSDERTASGVPDAVSLTIAGPSNLVDNLREDRLSATLDLADVTGDYQQRIQVLVPQGVRLLELTPEEVSGTVESVVAKTVPVAVALLGAADSMLSPEYTADTVEVRGLNSVVERVVRVVGTVQRDADEQDVELFAVDEAGLPVVHASLVLEPATLSVNMNETAVLHTKRVALEVSEPQVDPFILEGFSLSEASVRVAGPKARLEDLESVAASVEPATAPEGAGEYTFTVTPQLPDEVVALDTVSAQVQLGAPPSAPDGDSNDSPNSTVRRPDSSQDGEPGNVVR